MNYLELINKCLVELNYKQVNAFSELIKNDHKKLKNILNVLNTEICTSDRWNFLLRKVKLIIPEGLGEIENTVNGRIETVIVDGIKFKYFADFEKFLLNSQPQNSYSLFNDKILFPIADKKRNVEIIYYTSDCVKSVDGNEKYIFEYGDDESLIPVVFAEPLLVYGACMRLKGNPQHVRFNYWMNMYKDALANMRSRVSLSMDEIPSVKMHRR